MFCELLIVPLLNYSSGTVLLGQRTCCHTVTELAISTHHSRLTPAQPILTLTIKRPVSGRVDNRVSILKSLALLGRGKAGSDPRIYRTKGRRLTPSHRSNLQRTTQTNKKGTNKCSSRTNYHSGYGLRTCGVWRKEQHHKDSQVFLMRNPPQWIWPEHPWSLQ